MNPPPVFLHPHEQAALGLTAPDTAPLTAEVVAMVDRLRTRAKHQRATWDDGDMEFKAADMLTALAAQLAERDAELARVTVERGVTDQYDSIWCCDLDETGSLHMCSEGDPGAIEFVPRDELDAANRRIAALTEALTIWRDAFATGRNEPLHIAYEATADLTASQPLADAIHAPLLPE